MYLVSAALMLVGTMNSNGTDDPDPHFPHTSAMSTLPYQVTDNSG